MSILDDALRQFQWVHNNGAVTIISAYDKEITERAVADLQRQIEDMTAERDALQKRMRDANDLVNALVAERDAWKGTHDGLHRVYLDIGANLGADMPAELVNEVARRRMAELAAARALISEVEHAEEGLPKSARYAIEWYRKGYPEC